MNTKEKMCEYCGKKSIDYFYRIIVEVDYIIFLKNPHISKNNKEQRFVVLSNETRVDYSIQINSEQAISFSDIIPHIFCSECCEDKFLYQYRQYFSEDIHLKTTIVYNNNLFSPVIFAINAFGERYDICDICNTKYPNCDRLFTSMNIQKFKKITGKFGANPLVSKEYSIAFSDITENQINGTYYLYKFGDNTPKLKFCSNECIFEYCMKNNYISIFKSNIEKGSIRAITPHLIEINKSLNNNYLLRPLLVKQI